MNRETLKDRLGLEPSANDVEIVAAAKAELARLNRLAASASPEVAKVHQDALRELEAMLTACGLVGSGGFRALPKVSPPMLLGVVAAVLLLGLGVAYGTDMASWVKHLRRDPRLQQAVADARSQLEAGRAELDGLATNVGLVVPTSFGEEHRAALATADSATKAKDDAAAKHALDVAVAAQQRQRTKLMADAQVQLGRRLGELEQQQQQLVERGKQFAKERSDNEAKKRSVEDRLLNDSRQDAARRADQVQRSKWEAELAALERRDLPVALAVEQTWSEAWLRLAAKLNGAIRSAQPAVRSGQNLAPAAAEIQTGEQIAKRLEVLAAALPTSLQQHNDLRLTLANEPAELWRGAPAAARSLLDRWLEASSHALAAEQYDEVRRLQQVAQWLLAERRLETWGELRHATAAVQARLSALAKPEALTAVGPTQWLGDVGAKVEAQVAAADTEDGFAEWQQAVDAVVVLADCFDRRTRLQQELSSQRAQATARVPEAIWQLQQPALLACDVALWQRNAAAAEQALAAIAASAEERAEWLRLATSVQSLRKSLAEVRVRVPDAGSAAEGDLLQVITNALSTRAAVATAVALAQEASVLAVLAWEPTQPIGEDVWLTAQVRAMGQWQLTAGTKAKLAQVESGLAERGRAQQAIDAAMAAMAALANLTWSRELKAFAAANAKLPPIDAEWRNSGCSRARLAELVGVASSLQREVEQAFVTDSAALALTRLASDLDGAQRIVAELRQRFGEEPQVKAAAAAAAAAAREQTVRLLLDLGFSEAAGSARDAKTGYPTKIVHDQTRAALVLIPAGEFTMGSPESEANRGSDEVQHRRVIREAFYLGVTEVTQSQWQAVMGNNPSHFTDNEDLPVEQVSWDDCQQFLQRAKGSLRLPSEAEWEYACRAGTDGPFSFGPTISTDQVNYDGNFPYGNGSKGQYRQRTITAGSLPANRWGLHEMHGNVWEWCADTSSAYPGTGTEEPAGGAGARVLRGGSQGDPADLCRAANRNSNAGGNRNNHVGGRRIDGHSSRGPGPPGTRAAIMPRGRRFAIRRLAAPPRERRGDCDGVGRSAPGLTTSPACVPIRDGLVSSPPRCTPEPAGIRSYCSSAPSQRRSQPRAK